MVPGTFLSSRARETRRLGRTGAGACGPLYERHRRGPLQFDDPGLLSALAASRESEESGADGLHARAAHDPQCDAKTSDALAAGGDTPCLNLKTVADTLFFSRGLTPFFPLLLAASL